MVCGSVGYGGMKELDDLKGELKRESFNVIEQFVDVGQSSKVRDFRCEKVLSKRIMEHDIRLLSEADVLVVLANRPSFGAGVEICIAWKAGKPVIAFCPRSVPTPWPIALANHIAKTKEELLVILRTLEADA